MKYLITQQMIAEYNKSSVQKVDTVNTLEKQLHDVSKKLERLEERYVLEEITKDMFDKFQLKFAEEKREIEKELSKIGRQVSNLEEYIETALRVSSKLATAWDSADYNDKQSLQHLAFPEGIYYNRKKDECRTPKVNEAFRYFADVAMISGEKKRGNCNLSCMFPLL